MKWTHACNRDGHKFEGRYDEEAVGSVSQKIYVRDICIYCGCTVSRWAPDRLEERKVTSKFDPAS